MIDDTIVPYIISWYIFKELHTLHLRKFLFSSMVSIILMTMIL